MIAFEVDNEGNQACANPGIFVRGVQVNLTKKKKLSRFLFVFFSPQLILQKSNGQFQRNYHFSRFQRGSNIFQGGSNFFQGGSNCLFPIETHITSDI